ncbi:unnamed protein product [Heligmosomoides polygyrus]|uniref:Peptidase M13 C-terminal domain-containing protein n=1 Tax=Heligmosomoides polygyrus TaxID=6339 RepID=A0A3P8DVP2_HELPZ|nr:unnamed protein product [Heligmosomoides polygyrus]
MKNNLDVFAAVGSIEQTHAVGTLMGSWVSVDYKNTAQNALYVSQPSLSMPRDFYTLPQFVDNLDNRAKAIEQVMRLFASDVLKDAQPYSDMITKVGEMSHIPPFCRNYEQQYNGYTLDTLNKAYPSIAWSSYFTNLLSSVEKAVDVAANQVVISQPSYFAWLNAIFAGNSVDQATVVNYIITQLLFDDFSFLKGAYRNVAKEHDYVPYAQRRGRGVTRIGRRYSRKFDDEDPAVGCMDAIMAYMPYGPGFVYVKAQQNRNAVVKDITLQTELVISNFQVCVTLTFRRLQRHHLTKSGKTFFAIIAAYNKNKTDYYTITNILKAGLENREAFRLLVAPDNKGDRSNFLQSPAMVNAWYQPERNSITFPYAIWNPPYYSYDYPQAYNYAGQGGTGGHELTHGFDDEGVQFGWDGTLTNCTWNQCGWMDTKSKTGFTDMAQCVVSQYSTQCCPEKSGNVHCANGATTQGENIADLGGQQAAYNAYREYIKDQGHEELRLPGLEQFTPNQIFWITYGYSWCMKQNDQNLVNQLLTNPHAPGSCRTNQVMQDIPSFGIDFGCRQGSPMYPQPDQRCKVWTSQ